MIKNIPNLFKIYYNYIEVFKLNEKIAKIVAIVMLLIMVLSTVAGFILI